MNLGTHETAGEIVERDINANKLHSNILDLSQSRPPMNDVGGILKHRPSTNHGPEALFSSKKDKRIDRETAWMGTDKTGGRAMPIGTGMSKVSGDRRLQGPLHVHVRLQTRSFFLSRWG